MLLALLFSQVLLNEPNMDEVNKAVMEANSKHCILHAGLAFAQFSNESAEMSAKYAVISCSRVNQALRGDMRSKGAFLEGVEKATAVRIAQWRVRAGAQGLGEYSKIAEELGFTEPFSFN